MTPNRQPLTEFHNLGFGLNIWQRYDSEVKADLFSTAITTNAGTILVDPIDSSAETLAIVPPAIAIVVTNENHVRASEFFSAKFSAPIFARPAAGISSARDPQELGDTLQIIDIDGAAPGEIALFSAGDGGTLVVGDALINFGSHGFTFLPAKYCTNQKLMRKSLRKLLDFNFERMLFAHGTPIMSNARDRLVALLAT